MIFLWANLKKNSLVLYFNVDKIFLFNVSVGRPIGMHCTWKIYLQHCCPIGCYLRLGRLLSDLRLWRGLLYGLTCCVRWGVLWEYPLEIWILYFPNIPLRRGRGVLLEIPPCGLFFLGPELPNLGNVVMRLFPHAVFAHGCGLGWSSRQ